VGRLLLLAREDTGELIHVAFLRDSSKEEVFEQVTKKLRQKGFIAEYEHRPASFTQAQQQLNDYFDGDRKTLDLPYELILSGERGGRLQELFNEIPYGSTLTYGKVAGADHAQAVGQACARNPLPLIIPCHRLMPVGGGLGNAFIGGLDIKQALLNLEERHAI
jgi:methylated-DNA-[protein]-cysteine S-methyltransferase